MITLLPTALVFVEGVVYLVILKLGMLMYEVLTQEPVMVHKQPVIELLDERIINKRQLNGFVLILCGMAVGPF